MQQGKRCLQCPPAWHICCNVIRPLLLQADHRRIRQWRLLYGIQALGDKWRSLERRKDRQRQAFDAAIDLATDTDFQQSVEEAKEQLDQAVSIEVNYLIAYCPATAFEELLHSLMLSLLEGCVSAMATPVAWQQSRPQAKPSSFNGDQNGSVAQQTSVDHRSALISVARQSSCRNVSCMLNACSIVPLADMRGALITSSTPALLALLRPDSGIITSALLHTVCLQQACCSVLGYMHHPQYCLHHLIASPCWCCRRLRI